MRKAALLALSLGGLAVAGAAMVYERLTSPPQPVAVAEKPEVATAASPDVAPVAPNPAPPAPKPAQQAATPPVPASAAVSDLPTIEIKPRPIYAVPNDEPPMPKVTLYDRNGKEIITRQASLPPYSPPPAPPPPPAAFGGQAQAAGATTLAVAGKAVRLFGVRLADPRDRCGLGSGDARNCSDVARDALAQRLRRYPSVSCQTPPGQRGDPAAICIDASGTDLGGFLVAEGYALADTSQSYEYFGSEGVARYYRRGLWRNR